MNACDPSTVACTAQVSFGKGMVLPGDDLSINDIANEPKVEITECKKDAVYAFLVVSG